jgi:hypothetical protein
MKVEIQAILNKEMKEAHVRAMNAVHEASVAHKLAEDTAFMELMSKIGVSIGDRVIIQKKQWDGEVVSDDAILQLPRKFVKVKKDGTASLFEYHVYGTYTVEKFNPPA